MRKKILLTLLGMTLTASLATADPVIISDEWPGSLGSGGSADVIAGNNVDRRFFDIQQVVIDADLAAKNLELKLYFDYGLNNDNIPNNTALDPFVDGSLKLAVGDLFLTNESSNQMFAIPLASRAAFTAYDASDWAAATKGVIYNPVNAQTGRQSLSAWNGKDIGATGTSYYYRSTFPTVWIKSGTDTGWAATVATAVNDNGNATWSGSDLDYNPANWNGTVAQPNYGGAKYLTTVTITDDDAFDAIWGQNSGTSIAWASTLCANDIITSTVYDYQVPEPSAYIVLLAGLGGIVYTVRRRRLSA